MLTSETRGTYLNIGGHGNEGLLETGCGQAEADENSQVTYNNYDQNGLNELRTRYTILISIHSCNTGAGNGGALLLFNLAKLWKVPVRARTGLTYTKSIHSPKVFYEKNSVWQLATPDMLAPPPTIHAPSPPKNNFFSDELNQTISASLQQVMRAQVFINVNGVLKEKNMSNDTMRAFVDSLSQSLFFSSEGEPVGKITATILLYWSHTADVWNMEVCCNSFGSIIGRNISCYLPDSPILTHILS
ncbi:hypothetical protein LRS06_21985 [Hymenobacter sp. J193]|uniref:hypothetical protein n=1 Tax=Hymenobacter sp. J193 TaxID=2898429 RepID=UPI0021512B4C|nr:hypothetical protein [Hymenobacter sp. J193]MCR5890401.1 hypothetical protein [Hymenobacter sp. J193]